MAAFSLWRKVRQKLRRSRRPMWQLGCLLIMLAAIAANMNPANAAARSIDAAVQTYDALQGKPESGARSVIAALSDQRAKVTVKLRRIYICGIEAENIGVLSAKDTLDMMRKHPEWTAVLDEQGGVVMEQRIDDLSEACKRSAYFGLDKEGNLSLFDGSPKREKVLRTFFQLDVNYMESSLPQERIDELMRGIRISDKDEFNSVLSTFGDYALDRTEKVMKRTL
ncbi:BofC C-terminal domain-containing protein [Paenibacillus sp. R14(2021)]|uniref:BofC C-terminal domain-containing protein n=1 Tax=Paenibacillus sp. R14(2021) TaxID=2859228 RepID=UPI001C613020|nr:BofC C-terminal domain-containing protein [Paenibacillus sp. R14(2021)]